MKRIAQWPRKQLGGVLLALLLAGGCQQALSAAPVESFILSPVPAQVAHEAPGKAQAIFAGGCYWGVEGVFSHVVGVTSAVSGFHGGDANTAEYERVSEGNTGHAESVLVTYDPAKIRYDQLLRIFFSAVADPTQLNRQGPDEGSQYRSALVPMTPEQSRVAAAYLAQLRASGLWHRPIVTRIEPLPPFLPGCRRSSGLHGPQSRLSLYDDLGRAAHRRIKADVSRSNTTRPLRGAD